MQMNKELHKNFVNFLTIYVDKFMHFINRPLDEDYYNDFFIISEEFNENVSSLNFEINSGKNIYSYSDGEDEEYTEEKDSDEDNCSMFETPREKHETEEVEKKDDIVFDSDNDTESECLSESDFENHNLYDLFDGTIDIFNNKKNFFIDLLKNKNREILCLE